MSKSHSRHPSSSPYTLDHVPDFSHFREEAHRERTRAINSALAAVWRRVRRQASPNERDAGFWQA